MSNITDFIGGSGGSGGSGGVIISGIAGEDIADNSNVVILNNGVVYNKRKTDLRDIAWVGHVQDGVASGSSIDVNVISAPEKLSIVPKVYRISGYHAYSSPSLAIEDKATVLCLLETPNSSYDIYVARTNATGVSLTLLYSNGDSIGVYPCIKSDGNIQVVALYDTHGDNNTVLRWRVLDDLDTNTWSSENTYTGEQYQAYRSNIKYNKTLKTIVWKNYGGTEGDYMKFVDGMFVAATSTDYNQGTDTLNSGIAWLEDNSISVTSSFNSTGVIGVRGTVNHVLTSTQNDNIHTYTLNMSVNGNIINHQLASTSSSSYGSLYEHAATSSCAYCVFVGSPSYQYVFIYDKDV